jgi:hypothetical protein
MIKTLGISIILPILIMALLTFSGFEMAAHLLSIWPLEIVRMTGVMGVSPEGVYNRWYDASTIFSLFIQTVVIFVVFYKRKIT